MSEGKNMRLAARAVEWCLAAGVREVVLCAGARNLPLVTTFHTVAGLRLWNFPEERSAAFFALGRMQAGAGPVAVVVTSGTAAAELLPAAIEACYQGLPLVLVTADRPARFRRTGAPQSIEQPGLFGPYARLVVDAGPDDEWSPAVADGGTPAHLNLCFEEPILDGPEVLPRFMGKAGGGGDSCAGVDGLPPSPNPIPEGERALSPGLACCAVEGRAGDKQRETSRTRSVGDRGTVEWDGFGSGGRLLVMVGKLEVDEEGPVERFLRRLGAPVWLEMTSNLFGKKGLEGIWLRKAEKLPGLGLTHVLRLGGVPNARLWRDLENLRHIHVRSVSRQGWAGLGRACETVAMPLRYLDDWMPALASWPDDMWRAAGGGTADNAISVKKAVGILTEKEWIRAISEAVPVGAAVFLGNSLPIREWQVAGAWRKGSRFYANRGANGIDGEISSFLGVAESFGEAWGVFGDLTTLYDLAAPWVLRQMREKPLRLLVINNGGGGIFATLPVLEGASEAVRRTVLNPHRLEFSGWAKFWGMEYRRLGEPGDFANLPPGPVVLEVVVA